MTIQPLLKINNEAGISPFGEKQRDDVTFTEYGEFATDPIAKSPL
jgi:hypothetical protein